MYEVGGNSKYHSAAEVINFLKCVTPVEQFEKLQGRWVSNSDSTPGACCQRCPGDSEEAQFWQLTEFAPADCSPLLRLLHEKRLETFFQPILRNDRHTVWGYECLMRGRDAQNEVISPAEILKMAWQENLMFMLDRVCRESHIHNAADRLPRDVSILINFIPTAIYEPAFCLRSTLAAVRNCGLDPSRIVFEVVETEHVRDHGHLNRILEYYRSGGFRVALDDIGSGFSGLSLLADLNPDLIKIDRHLVQGAALSGMHAVVVKGLVQIGKDSGKLVLAEGIETEAEFETMAELGVDLFQGFLLGRPSPEPLPSAQTVKATTSQRSTTC